MYDLGIYLWQISHHVTGMSIRSDSMESSCRHSAVMAGLPKSNARVSLLIPARNEEGFIGNCLRSLISQDHDNMEIIVLDDHSTDRTRAIIESHGAKVSSFPVNLYLQDGLKKIGPVTNSQCATGDVLFLY